MRNLKRKLTHKDSLRAAPCRPQVETLEARWMPGDTILGGLLGQALLSTAFGSVNISSMGGGG